MNKSGYVTGFALVTLDGSFLGCCVLIHTRAMGGVLDVIFSAILNVYIPKEIISIFRPMQK